MADRARSRRSPIRFLAPLALAVAVAGTYLVIHHALDGDSSNRPGRTTTTTARQGTTPTRHHKRVPRFYRVKSGDNLSTISARTGVPLPQLESLNPKAVSSLQVGQRLRLRR